jgi:hypothetical protein
MKKKRKVTISNLDKLYQEIGVSTWWMQPTNGRTDDYLLSWNAPPPMPDCWRLKIHREILTDPFDNSDNCIIELYYYDSPTSLIPTNKRSWVMPIDKLNTPEILALTIKKMIEDPTFNPDYVSITYIGPPSTFQPRPGITTRYSTKMINGTFYGAISGSIQPIK